jgi:3-deoxy-D-manno-octulosonic-acid transferase
LNFLYYFLATLLYIFALPYLLYLRFKPKYKDSIPSRFFLKNNPSFSEGGIWFHACSFGEVRSLKPFIDRINPSDVRLSVITQTGFHEARSYANAQVRYLPFEIFLPFWIGHHKVLIVMEAELWPLLFIVAKARGIKTVLLNARISDRSYASYQRFAWVYRWIFSHVDLILAQSALDKERLERLGGQKIEVCGNIKALSTYGVSRVYVKAAGKRVVILASTHEGEEALILSQLALSQNDQLIVVPRHPERFSKVDALLDSYAKNLGRSYSRLSEQNTLDSDIILCDTMGELINLYAIADVVILGGSFVEGVGGHNPLEPAFFGAKIISGEFIFNQKVLFELVENSVTCKLEDLKDVFDSIDTFPKSTIVHHGDIAPLLEQILGS